MKLHFSLQEIDTYWSSLLNSEPASGQRDVLPLLVPSFPLSMTPCELTSRTFLLTILHYAILCTVENSM